MRFVTIASLLVFACTLSANGEGFLKQDPRLVHLLADREGEFREAMASVKGCGSPSDAVNRFSVVQRLLEPMWAVLPKNDIKGGRVEWRMLRYMAHRYFMQQSSLLIRGFEPSRTVNTTNFGGADILSKHMPSLTDIVLDGRRSSLGFTLEDAVALVATMEQLIFDSESSLLATAYKQQRKMSSERLNHQELTKVIESYIVHWMIGEDQESLNILLTNRVVLAQSIPHWRQISSFAEGMIKSMEFSRQRAPQPGHGLVAMTQTYSFDEAHEAVGAITKTFASYWETECQTIKSSLVALDKTGTGRISLSDFYGANADGEWRFGESEAYLRELGALDETSGFGSKYVIIPNYLQGASNCIVTTSNYFVCCVNECEDILSDIETSVGAPVAHPDDILGPLANLTNFDDEPPKLAGTLTKQLQQIADTHGGKVPLHGRLFSQWLHYVFPRECPFPHKSGTVSSQAPREFGNDVIVSDQTKNAHASARNSSALQEQMLEQAEAQWMSQWTEEEELIVDYSLHLAAPWVKSDRVLVIVLAFVGVALVGLGGIAAVPKSSGTHGDNCYNSKAHFV